MWRRVAARAAGGIMAAGLVAAGVNLTPTPAAAAEPEDILWTGKTCEAAFTTRVTTNVLLEVDVYPLPGLRVSEPLVSYEGTYAQRQWKRQTRIAKALPEGDGTGGTGDFTVRPGETFAFLVPCELTTSSWRTPDGLQYRPGLLVSREDGRSSWDRDLFPKWVKGTDVVLRDRNTRGDSLYEIK